MNKIHESAKRLAEYPMPNRKRPFAGQPHTFMGQRGEAPVLSGFNLRDIYDMTRLAFVQSSAPDDPNNIDFDAVAQNLCCNLEALMKNYPNIKKGEEGYRDPVVDPPRMLTDDRRPDHTTGFASNA